MTAEELMLEFPPIPQEAYAEMHRYMKHYIIIDKYYQAHCTACNSTFEITDSYNIRHRHGTECPCCGVTNDAIMNYHNFKGYVREDKEHFFVLLRNPKDKNLYVSCIVASLYFLQYQMSPKIEYYEAQRYIFTDKHAFRFGKSSFGRWVKRTQFSEPVWESNVSSWYRMSYYNLINKSALEGTYYEHSALDQYSGNYEASYLKFYIKHPGVERMVKACQVTNNLVSKIVDSVYVYPINWTENEVHKMLGVTKDVFNEIRRGRIEYGMYFEMVKRFPGASLKQIIGYARTITGNYGLLDSIVKRINVTEKKIVDYLSKKEVTIRDYSDYIRLCDSVGYNINDSAVMFPRDFKKMHDRIEQIRQALENEKKAKQLEKQNEALLKLIKSRKKIEFESGDYIIRQPSCIKEIIEEGQKLAHCVGGYAERHADGKLTIMFLRKKDDADTPYYTIEVSNDYKIVQCRGYKNNWVSNGGTEKPDEIIQFEKEYQNYLDKVAKQAAKRKKKTA